MGRTSRLAVQQRLPARALVTGALLLPFLACTPPPATLASNSFRLEPGQIARLTVRNSSFCAGRGSLEATLRFTGEAGNTVARKHVLLSCGGSAQFDLAGNSAPGQRIIAALDVRPASPYPPEAAVEIITLESPGRESAVVHPLR